MSNFLDIARKYGTSPSNAERSGATRDTAWFSRESSRSGARETIKAALAFLQEHTRAFEAQSQTDRGEIEGLALSRWALREGRIFSELPEPELSGAEHSVWAGYDGRVWKVTYPGHYGLFPAFCAPCEGCERQIHCSKALASYYLERLILACDVFGDDVRLEGVAFKESRLRIVTSQFAIDGAHPDSMQEIDAYMTERGFYRLAPYHYFSPEMNLAAFDAHEGNLIRAVDGELYPIDLVLSRPCDDFKAQLEERIREIERTGECVPLTPFRPGNSPDVIS